MKNAKRTILFSASLLSVFFVTPYLAQAQRMARGAATPTVQPRHSFSNVTIVRPPAGHGATISSKSSASAKQPTTTKAMNLNSWDPLAFGGFLPQAPGPGNEYGYLGGVNQNWGIEASIDPATEWRIAAAERFLRNTRGFNSGFYLLSGGGAYYLPPDESAVPAATEEQSPEEPQEQQQQPQYIILQQAPTARDAGLPSESTEPAAPPIPDEGEFTLVLRDGTKIQAVAFTHSNKKIIYITNDGGRHTLADSDLDADATVRLNQERGTPLQLPL